jgi:hypothetical protein
MARGPQAGVDASASAPALPAGGDSLRAPHAKYRRINTMARTAAASQSQARTLIRAIRCCSVGRRRRWRRWDTLSGKRRKWRQSHVGWPRSELLVVDATGKWEPSPHLRRRRGAMTSRLLGWADQRRKDSTSERRWRLLRPLTVFEWAIRQRLSARSAFTGPMPGEARSKSRTIAFCAHGGGSLSTSGNSTRPARRSRFS